MKRRILFVAPHPDDAELGIGATIIKLKEAGNRVFIVDLTSGEPTPFGSQEKRIKETLASNKILKIDKRINLRLKNRYLFDSKEARLLLAEQIRILRPDILFCPYGEDAHPDHVATTKITEAARFYSKYTKVALKGKPHYPKRFFYYFCSHLKVMPRVSFFIDISRQFKKKISAVRCYRSQFVVNRKNNFIFDYIESSNRYFGKLIGTDYAEPVFSKEALKIDDINASL